MNITTIKKSGITTLSIKKTAQVITTPRGGFLANQPKSDLDSAYFYSNYPPTTDTSLILPVGTTLQILGVYPGNTRYAPAYITVLSSTGRTFDIMARDIGRFTM